MSISYKSGRPIKWSHMVNELHKYGIHEVDLSSDPPPRKSNQFCLSDGKYYIFCNGNEDGVDEFTDYNCRVSPFILELISWLFKVQIASGDGVPVRWPDPGIVLERIRNNSEHRMVIGSFVKDEKSGITGRLIDVTFSGIINADRNINVAHHPDFWRLGGPTIAVIAYKYRNDYKIHRCEISSLIHDIDEYY